MRNACLEDNAARITCPKCGKDLGPVQPLPDTKVICPKCKKWVPAYAEINNEAFASLKG